MSETIRCIIVDDEPLAIRIIQNYINKISYLEFVASFESPIDAFDALKSTAVDLIFLDIDMPHISGLELAESLDQAPGIIFTTAHRNFAVESYEVNAFDYLLKPIKFSRFLKSVDRFQQTKASTKTSITASHIPAPNLTNFLYVNSNKKHIKVFFDDILYVESIKDYIRIHCDHRNIITKDKISDFTHKLPTSFIRIHRSFIVNSDKITAFTSTDVEIGPKEIPIGASYKKTVMEFLK